MDRVHGTGFQEIRPWRPLIAIPVEIVDVVTVTDSCTEDSSLFQNSRGSRLTRVGISEILNKYVAMMKKNGLTQYVTGAISPHSLRHSKAIHLLRAGVPLIYIRDYLGHVSVTTTEIYARVDAEEKRKAVENAYPVQSQEKIPKWEKDKDLLEWLTNLCN